MPDGTRKMRAVRTFIAVLLQEELKRHLSNLQKEIKSLAGDVKWVAPENLHVTIKFLGDVPEERLTDVFEAVESAARQVEPFQLSLGRAGGFPNLSRPRVIWVGVETGLEELSRLADAVEACLENAGFERENKQFRAHITIGRVREGKRAPDLAQFFAADRAWSPAEQQVNAVAVVSSDLNPKGPVYTVMKSIGLGSNSVSAD